MDQVEDGSSESTHISIRSARTSSYYYVETTTIVESYVGSDYVVFYPNRKNMNTMRVTGVSALPTRSATITRAAPRVAIITRAAAASDVWGVPKTSEQAEAVKVNFLAADPPFSLQVSSNRLGYHYIVALYLIFLYLIIFDWFGALHTGIFS